MIKQTFQFTHYRKCENIDKSLKKKFITTTIIDMYYIFPRPNSFKTNVKILFWFIYFEVFFNFSYRTLNCLLLISILSINLKFIPKPNLLLNFYYL